MIVRRQVVNSVGLTRATPRSLRWNRRARVFSSASGLLPTVNGDSSRVTTSTNQRSQSTDFRSWQALHNVDIQRVTQTAMIHELTQQQTRSIEQVVPWFLNTMPGEKGIAVVCSSSCARF